jgi:Flp pilus assembly protein TadD
MKSPSYPRTRLLLATVTTVFLAVGCGGSAQRSKIENPEELYLELAETYVAKGAKEAAVPLLRRILAERPRDTRARVLYASALRDLGLHSQALAEFRRVLRLDANFAAAHAGIAILYDLDDRGKLAIRHHRRAVALAPGHAQYHNNLGFSLYLQGETDEAITELERALALDPGLAVAYNNLGFAYGSKGELRKARRMFEAIAGEATVLLNMALVHDRRGHPRKARKLRRLAYKTAPELRPSPER